MIVRRHPLSFCLLGALVCLSADAAAIQADDAPPSEVIQLTAATDSQQDELLQIVDSAIDITSRRYLSGEVHTPWQIMHGLLALRHDFRIKVDGEKVSALEWLRQGQTFNGLPIVEHSPYGGRFHPFTEPYAFEGHPNQFLAILTMSDLPADFSFTTNVNGSVTIEDMLRNAQMEVNDREEITWTLWSLSRYLPIDSQWTNKAGEPWSIERLVQIQTYASPNDAACGGTHGLFALSLARNAALATGQPLRCIWFEADQKIRSYVAMARSLQNSDGSLSSKYFAGPGHSSEFGKRLATSGHVLEFLMVGARDEDLESEWLRSAVRSVAQDLVTHRRTAADCGPLYHALHALVLYRQRMGVTPSQESQPPEVLAQTDPDSSEEATDNNPESQPVEVVEPEQFFVGTENESEESDDGQPAATLADVKSDREAPQDETSASIPKPTEPETPSEGVRGLFDPADSTESEETTTEAVISEAIVPEAVVADDVEATETEPVEVASVDEQAVEEVRSPEDNAPDLSDEPQVMEDGYVVPMPPTMD